MLAAGLAAIIIAGGIYYWRSTAWESTDNAQIDGFVFPVSARVSGYVSRVMVDDNQYVEAGTVLAQLDPKDYEVAVAVAKGTLANNEASAASLTSSISTSLCADSASANARSPRSASLPGNGIACDTAKSCAGSCSFDPKERGRTL